VKGYQVVVIGKRVFFCCVVQTALRGPEGLVAETWLRARSPRLFLGGRKNHKERPMRQLKGWGVEGGVCF
jgi:hypothetical protein